MENCEDTNGTLAFGEFHPAAHFAFEYVMSSYINLFERYEKLLEFTQWASKQPCCNVCDCRPCEALSVLRKIGEENA